MKLNTKKRIAADLAKSSQKRVKLDPARAEEIKEAITKVDLRQLMENGTITIVKKKGISRARAKKLAEQRQKKRRRGQGSRKGSANARLNSKKDWMNRIRLLREILKDLKMKEKIDNATYRDLYRKSKGGFFRSRRHLKLYINERGLIKNGK